METLGIYVHIPYCIKKCNYCDFYSVPISCGEKDPKVYVDEICSDISLKGRVYGNKYTVDSVFFGGGTPSLLSADSLGKILTCIRDCFDVSFDCEISLEANPETVTFEKAVSYLDLGFNRVSMGVQSLNDYVLSILGRVHDSTKAISSFEILRNAGFSDINLDLMFGVPGQNFSIFKDSFDRVLSLSPSHISFYGLQIEEGTPFYTWYKDGKIDIPSWEENRRMYHYAVDSLKSFGYHHYEVSNAAKPGFECRHNLKYWTMKPYLGFGTSAHSFIDGKRTDDDHPNLETDMIFTGLRLVDGYEFGEAFCIKYKDIIRKLADDGYIIKEENKLRLSSLGLDNTNYVMEEMINA